MYRNFGSGAIENGGFTNLKNWLYKIRFQAKKRTMYVILNDF